MIRFIGREFKDSSPESSELKGCPARIPEISLVVVPLFPTSRMEDGAVGRFARVQQEKAITERMRRRAEIDVLTNVYNHKAFEEYCAKELAECTTNALFVMLDIDDFKMINDTQGHACDRRNLFPHHGRILPGDIDNADKDIGVIAVHKECLRKEFQLFQDEIQNVRTRLITPVIVVSSEPEPPAMLRSRFAKVSFCKF